MDSRTDNPYEAPQAESGEAAGVRQGPGLVNHVRFLGVLVIIHGGLLLLMGLFFILLGILFSVSVSVVGPAEEAAQLNNIMFRTLPIVYALMGLPAVLAGGLQIGAGVRMFQYRNRVLAIVSLVVGLAGSSTCYCVFTVVPMVIYGLIVLLNGPVVQAFELRRQGQTLDEVLDSFYDVR